MAITTTAAILGGAAIAGSAYSASKTSSAGRYAADQTTAATRETNALNEKIYNTTRADNEPFRNLGVGAAGAVGSAFGLSGYKPMTSARPSSYASPSARPTYASTPVPNVGGVSMTGSNVAAAKNAARSDGGGNFAGTSPMEPAPAGPQDPGFDTGAYLNQYGDVAAEFERLNSTPEGQATLAANGINSADDYAVHHYATNGQSEGRAVTPYADDGGYEAPEGYTDPTAPNGYSTGARPDAGPGPAAYSAPVRMAAAAPDLSVGAFRASPDYQFRVDQGNRGLSAVASAGGGLMSGARQKAAIRFNQNIADGEYTDWRNFTVGQANFDRSRNDAIYSEDRGFGYGQSRDARGDFTTDRSRTDGLYADDRANTQGRYDTRNNQLLSMAGFGANANAANQNAAQTFAQSTNQANMTAANARGQAATTSANAWGGALNNVMTTGAYLYGKTL